MDGTILLIGSGTLVVVGLISLFANGPKSFTSSFVSGGLTLLWIALSVIVKT